MKTLIKILCLSSFLFAEDVYPYFSDPVKQLEFEKEKIQIIDIKEKEMVLSGGSQFNWAYLFNKNQPITAPGDIKTEYIYRYNFEIIKNGENISEIELLIETGLIDEANKIKDDYKNKIDIYETTISNNKPYNIKYKNYDRKKHNMIMGDINFLLRYSNLILMGIFANSSFYNLNKYLSMYEGTDAKKYYKNNLFKSLALTSLTIFSHKKINNRIVKVKDILNIKKPVLKQTLTNEQLKSISESYNRKLYNEILNK